jgi:hypothetical protein
MRKALLFTLIISFHTSARTQKITTDSDVHLPNKSFESPILLISYKGVVAPFPASQAKDRLLWYEGKKIDDSTLITPEATLVRWSKPRILSLYSPKKTPLQG